MCRDWLFVALIVQGPAAIFLSMRVLDQGEWSGMRVGVMKCGISAVWCRWPARAHLLVANLETEQGELYFPDAEVSALLRDA